MSDKVWKKISYYLGFVALGAVFGAVAHVGTVEVKDLDLWLHLAVGKFITFHGHVPSVDFLSFHLVGKYWSNHEWLFQVILYNLYNVFGFDGLIRIHP